VSDQAPHDGFAFMPLTTAPEPEPEPDPTPPDPSRTAAWLKRAQDGDGDAFNQLYGHLGQRLFAWVRMCVATNPDADVLAEDVAQEVWLTAWSDFGSLDTTKYTFRSWLFGIARNRLLQALRNRALRRIGDGGTANLAALENVPQSVISLVPTIARATEVQALKDYVATLSETDRELVRRCGLEGQSAKVVAERTNSTQDAVTKRWQRLRAKMKMNRRLRTLID
jgi:RNA polymerase sigma-70 factor (ECF subfamily)